MKEIRQLIGGFPFDRWKPLAERRLADLDELSGRIQVMRSALRKALRCECLDVDACGRELEKEAPPRGGRLPARTRS